MPKDVKPTTGKEKIPTTTGETPKVPIRPPRDLTRGETPRVTIKPPKK